jgi:uncharacterized protein YkwD
VLPTSIPEPTAPPQVAAGKPEIEAAGKDDAVAELSALIREARAAAGVACLVWSDELATAATAHVRDMATHGFVSHTGSDGSDIVTRMQRAGYDPSWHGEIIVQTRADPQAAFEWWSASQIHRNTLLGAAYRDVGIAIAPYPEDAGRAYYVVVFGHR